MERAGGSSVFRSDAVSTSALCNKFNNDNSNFAKKQDCMSGILDLEQGVGEFEVLVALDCSPLCFRKRNLKVGVVLRSAGPV